ncbi:MAG: KpsF/GutQ family sugar-phosphate isomerase [Verrucomicrobiales bacterium]
MDYPAKARQVIELEIAELQRLRDRVGVDLTEAVRLLLSVLEAGRKIIVCGVGKSGNIGSKIAATFNSTGAASVVLNAQDALHGDLGMVNEGDVVMVLSHSGETWEVLNLLPHLKSSGVKMIAMTGGSESTLARHSDVVLDTSIEREACPLNLAPTSSSTVQLVLGDALAMVLLEARGFCAEDFARLHPGGRLGRALLTKVSDIMRRDAQTAIVRPLATVQQVLTAMTFARSGAAIVANDDGTLAGIFTQGDFVRAFQKGGQIGHRTVREFMTRQPVSINQDKLAVEVLNILKDHAVDDLVVVDQANRPVGIVDTQDLSRLKLV